MNFSDFHSVSPFPPLRVPPYRPFKSGDWELRKTQGPPVIRGYFGGLQMCSPANWMLTHRNSVWMSVTPMELESAAHHAQEATGDVLVMGFGMGVVAWNLAQKSDVETVRVVEKDPEILNIAARLLALPGWEKLRDKVVLHQADALEFKGSADVVLADIWPSLGDTDLRPHLRQMATNVKADRYAAWGLELDFIEWCAKKKFNPDFVGGRQWIEYSSDIGVPLIMADNLRKARTMAKAAVAAARNVLMY